MAETQYILAVTKSGAKEWIALPSGDVTPHDQGWGTITDTPTTVAGYGITDTAVIVPTPADNQIAVWASAASIGGTSGFTWDGTDLIVDGNGLFTSDIVCYG